MTIEEFISSLDFEENDYFYHVTGRGNADKILEEGLYVEGTNILDTNNILETTTLPLTQDMVLDSSNFKEYLEGEMTNIGVRDTSEFVVLGAPKSCMKQIVSEFNTFKDEVYYEGVIHSEYIMGYFDNETLEFTPNEGFCFGTDESYVSISF